MVLGVARATARKATNAISHGGYHGPGHSGIPRLSGRAQARHASTTVPPPHGQTFIPRSSHKLFSRTRNLWTRIFNQLTAPGLRVPTYAHNSGTGAARSLHSATNSTIKSGLSFGARTSLSSGPLYKAYLPRPPSPGIRAATNVGLGTARNFSTARPIFQNLVDNVPVVGRAFYEADLDLRKGYIKHPKARRGNKSTAPKKTGEMVKPRDALMRPTSQEEVELDIAHYFDSNIPPVITYLLVPLYPTAASRAPLPVEPILTMDSPPGLLPPLSYFGPYHTAHESHAARVEGLFRRLDQTDVWRRGASYSSYCQGTHGAGVCTVIAVEFSGWTAAEVRAVIGESGTGWCALEEHRIDDADDVSEFSSSIDPAEVASIKTGGQTEMSSSFIMPTLDVSTSLGSSLPPSPYLGLESLPSSSFSSRPMSPVTDPISDYDDPWRDDEFESSENGFSNNASDQSWERMGALEFSAQHSHRWV